jgi:8-oxo-dGTP diphosphatase
MGDGSIRVAAGILRRDGNVLACRRRLGDAFGGKWELPGGKVRSGETPAQALVRELDEELGIRARTGGEVGRIRHAYPGGPTVQLHFFEIEAFDGEMENRCFESIRWLPPADLGPLDWLDADRPLIRRLISGGARPLPDLAPGVDSSSGEGPA